MPLTVNEFVVYSSPRYYRLIFPDLKPKTKNGDLVSALSELKRWRFLTFDSHWDSLKLTPKGIEYQQLIQDLLDNNALHVPQSFGIFDYRSEPGRKAIINLIRFLSAKLDFSTYFRYLHVPIFDNDHNQEWMEIFGDNSTQNIDYLSKQGRNQLVEVLNQKARPHKKKSDIIQETLYQQDTPINLNLTLVKKFLKKNNLKRPEPLFNHFNLCEPRIFEIRERKFFVNLAELSKIYKLLEKYLSNFKSEENKWLSDYFKLLKLPTGKSGLFGFKAGQEMNYASQTDAFLNLAIEGPRIFAEQFTVIKELGELRHILFPVNPTESIVISCADLEMLYYFTIESEKCVLKTEINFISLKNYPEKYVSSRGKEFGKLISRSRSLEEALQIQAIMSEEDPEKRKKQTLKLRPMKENLQSQLENLSYMSASLISICQMITKKFNKEFGLTKCLCIYEKGYINLVDIGGSDRILTSINLGKVEFGHDLKKTISKIEDSLEEIVEVPNLSNE
ncbi:hypothetical protein [Candidatus Lokiarchaeum ossiferum]|uniref:hypothetical protein n=1 Tax=Candidatus Lokiarchaeum ossiferum TaxID=2951803 RepID=UPI00352C34A7